MHESMIFCENTPFLSRYRFVSSHFAPNPLYPAVSHCIQLYPYVSSCIWLYPAVSHRLENGIWPKIHFRGRLQYIRLFRGVCARMHNVMCKYPLCMGTLLPPCIAHTIDAIYCFPPTLLYCNIYHTMLVMANACATRS